MFCRMRAAILALILFGTGCATPDRLSYSEVDSRALDRTMRYAVWAPVDWRADESLPIVVFLHGAADDETCFDEAGVGESLDRALAEGSIPRVIVVVPDGRLGFWENWYDGSQNYRDWVLQEVMPEVAARYRTLPCPEGCHVAGTSMGGHGAVRFALFEPDQWSSIASLSGFILSTDQVMLFSEEWFTRLFIPMDRIWGPVSDRERIERHDPYLRWQTQADLRGARLLVAWAENDESRILESNKAFEDHLSERRIDHEAIVFRGGHDWKSWTPVIEQVLRFAVWGSIESAPGTALEAASEPAGALEGAAPHRIDHDTDPALMEGG